MNDRARPAASSTTRPSAQTLRAVGIHWTALVLLASALHVIVACGLVLAYPSETLTAPALTPLAGIVRHSLVSEEIVEECEYEYETVCEEAELVIADAPVAGQPGLRDEPIALDSPTEDAELPYEESFGSSEAGLSGAPFVGPATNGTIGMGGGAGGSFRGRGGCRELGVGGGGRRRCGDVWQPSTLVPHASRVRVGDKEEIPLEGMHVSVRVEGFRARVVLDCFFRNDRSVRSRATSRSVCPTRRRRTSSPSARPCA